MRCRTEELVTRQASEASRPVPERVFKEELAGAPLEVAYSWYEVFGADDVGRIRRTLEQWDEDHGNETVRRLVA